MVFQGKTIGSLKEEEEVLLSKIIKSCLPGPCGGTVVPRPQKTADSSMLCLQGGACAVTGRRGWRWGCNWGEEAAEERRRQRRREAEAEEPTGTEAEVPAQRFRVFNPMNWGLRALCG